MIFWKNLALYNLIKKKEKGEFVEKVYLNSLEKKNKENLNNEKCEKENLKKDEVEN